MTDFFTSIELEILTYIHKFINLSFKNMIKLVQFPIPSKQIRYELKNVIYLVLHLFVGHGIVVSINSLRRVTYQFGDLEQMKVFLNHLVNIATASGPK